MHAYSKPILGFSTIRSATFVELFQDYEEELVRAGYNHHVARLHLHSIAHFGVWLELEGVEFETIDEGTVAAFDRHRLSCRCPRTSRDRGAAETLDQGNGAGARGGGCVSGLANELGGQCTSVDLGDIPGAGDYFFQQPLTLVA